LRLPIMLAFLAGLAAAAFAVSRNLSPSLPLPSPPAVVPPAPAAAAPPAPPVIREGRVTRGDTLFALLRDGGVPEETAERTARARVGDHPLARVVIGKPFRFLLEGGEVSEFQYEPDAARLVRVRFLPEGPQISLEPIPLVVVPVAVRGTIEDSLFSAVEASGEDPALALDLSEVFAWQVDFFRDIRKGDGFNVLVEKVLRDGRFVRYGKVLAAEFINQGRRHTAFSWEGPGGPAGYFDEEGRSLRKEFLKAPLRFRRISSSFSYRRKHPVTRAFLPHLGTDYAAPVGTPVRSIGDGRVVARQTDSANGRMVKVRHNGTFSSAYAHLNSYAAGIGVGSAVKQGDIIGFVGSSGLSTGPHLHFVLYRNGQMVDPRRVETPQAAALPEDQREAFAQVVADRSSLLGMGGRQPSRVASRMDQP